MGYTTNVCLVGVSPRGLDLAFLDAGGVGVFDVDSLVVEGWLSCLVVGLVLVAAQGGYFGELILAEITLPGDLYGVVRQVRCQIQPPIEHAALVFTGSAAVGAGQMFELGVDPSFQTVVGLADGRVCPCASPAAGLRVFDKGFFV